mgnify:CR=1 FL=1
MFKKYLINAILFSILGSSNLALAESPTPELVTTKNVTANTDFATVKAKLSELLGFNITSIKASPLAGIVEVVTDQGLFYASADGKVLIQGKMYGLGQDISNLTERSLTQIRVDGMAKFANDMIVFPAKNEQHVVTVFTDITCGYCRKLHEQIDDYNDKGITVRYLAYPRSGVKDRAGNYSQGFKDLRSIWCNENPKQALTKAKTGVAVAARICDKPVEEEFNFGRQVGVTGTPAIIFSNGTMLPGYQDPNKLLRLLETAPRGS